MPKASLKAVDWKELEEMLRENFTAVPDFRIGSLKQLPQTKSTTGPANQEGASLCEDSPQIFRFLRNNRMHCNMI